MSPFSNYGDLDKCCASSFLARHHNRSEFLAASRAVPITIAVWVIIKCGDYHSVVFFTVVSAFRVVLCFKEKTLGMGVIELMIAFSRGGKENERCSRGERITLPLKGSAISFKHLIVNLVCVIFFFRKLKVAE